MAPTVEGDVLVVLVGTTKPLTGRDVARLVRRGSQSAVAEALERLTVHGLVHRDRVGRAFLHSLNREHLAAPAVEILAGLRTELMERLRRTLRSWEVKPFHASIFGSAARGDGDLNSDVDLLLVRPQRVAEHHEVWRSQVDDLAYRVLDWTGNHAGIVELPRADVADFVKESPAVLDQLRNDAITLAGISTALMFRPWL